MVEMKYIMITKGIKWTTNNNGSILQPHTNTNNNKMCNDTKSTENCLWRIFSLFAQFRFFLFVFLCYVLLCGAVFSLYRPARKTTMNVNTTYKMWYTNKNVITFAQKNYTQRERDRENWTVQTLIIYKYKSRVYYSSVWSSNASTKRRIEQMQHCTIELCTRVKKLRLHLYTNFVRQDVGMKEIHVAAACLRLVCLSHLIFFHCLWSTTSFLIDQCLTFIQV